MKIGRLLVSLRVHLIERARSMLWILIGPIRPKTVRRKGRVLIARVDGLRMGRLNTGFVREAEDLSDFVCGAIAVIREAFCVTQLLDAHDIVA